MFRKESDFEAFERVMVEAHLRQPIRILSYCVLLIALAGGTAGELDGSRQRSFDHEGIRPSAGEHRERTTIRRREVGAGNGKRSRVGADRSSGRPPTESEPIGDRGDKLITRIPSSGQIHEQTNRVPVSLPGLPVLLRKRIAYPFHSGFTLRFHSQTNRVPVSLPNHLSKLMLNHLGADSLLLRRDRMLRQRPVKDISQDRRWVRPLLDGVELETLEHGIGHLKRPARDFATRSDTTTTTR